MIAWSLDACRECQAIAAVVVAVPAGHEHGLDGTGVVTVDGGATRAGSVANALAEVRTEYVAIHDAARPLLTVALLDDLVAALAADPEADAIIAAAPVTDTVKKLRVEFPLQGNGNSTRVVGETLDRSELWGAQTPQVFRTEALRAALGVDSEVRDAATDEAMLIEAAGGKVLLHDPGTANLKVTTPLDLRVAELLLADRARG